MSKSILITRPKYDPATFHLFDWSSIVIAEAVQKQFAIYDLSGQKAIRANLESYISKNKPGILFFNGHGNANCITGHQGNVLIQSKDNERLTKDAIVYARSCEVGLKLGLALISAGTKSFIGYRAKFVFVTSRVPVKNSLDDPVAKLFLEPSNGVPISLIKGNSTGDAHQKSKREMLRNLRFMLSSKATKDMRDAATYLSSNYKNQVLHGDPNAVV